MLRPLVHKTFSGDLKEHDAFHCRSGSFASGLVDSLGYRASSTFILYWDVSLVSYFTTQVTVLFKIS